MRNNIRKKKIKLIQIKKNTRDCSRVKKKSISLGVYNQALGYSLGLFSLLKLNTICEHSCRIIER